MARARDEAREQRIVMEAVVDTYSSSERAMGWYYYLDGKMNVPFKARCRLARPISILKVKAEVAAVRNMNQRSSIGLAIPANPRGEE
jgi:hypothetical protein